MPDDTSDNWMQEGACQQHPPAVFFPQGHRAGPLVEAAKKICATCPVQPQCLEHALALRIDHGVWGGMSERQRRAERKRRRDGGTAHSPRSETAVATPRPKRDLNPTKAALLCRRISDDTHTQWMSLTPTAQDRLAKVLRQADDPTIAAVVAQAAGNNEHGRPLTTLECQTLATATVNTGTLRPITVDHLTPEQADMARRVQHGEGLDNVAADLDVSKSTVRAVFWSAEGAARADSINPDTGRRWRTLNPPAHFRLQPALRPADDTLFALILEAVTGELMGTRPIGEQHRRDMIRELRDTDNPAAVVTAAAAEWAARSRPNPTVPTAVDHLTRSETEAVALVAGGLSVSKTARRVGIAPGRVRVAWESATSTARADQINPTVGRHWRAVPPSVQMELQVAARRLDDTHFALLAAAVSGETGGCVPMSSTACRGLAAQLRNTDNPAAVISRTVATWERWCRNQNLRPPRPQERPGVRRLGATTEEAAAA